MNEYSVFYFSFLCFDYRCVLEGVGSNSSLTDFELNLSSNNLGLPGNLGGQILEQCLSTIRNISHLDISDNGMA